MFQGEDEGSIFIIQKILFLQKVKMEFNYGRDVIKKSTAP